MGRHADKALAGLVVLGLPQRQERPYEDPENGCPGGHYRTTFVDEVWSVTRRRTKDGGRVSSPRFTRAHWTLQEAAIYLEQEEERWHAHVDAQISRRMQVDIDKRKREQR